MHGLSILVSKNASKSPHAKKLTAFNDFSTCRAGGDANKRVKYLPADKQFLVTRNGVRHAQPMQVQVPKIRFTTEAGAQLVHKVSMFIQAYAHTCHVFIMW
jgi:hypothetical protein